MTSRGITAHGGVSDKAPPLHAHLGPRSSHVGLKNIRWHETRRNNSYFWKTLKGLYKGAGKARGVLEACSRLAMELVPAIS